MTVPAKQRTALAVRESNNVPADLGKLGFGSVQEPSYRRLLIATDGLERTGKSTFAFTAPEPIVYLTFAPGELEGVLDKEPWIKKRIWPRPFYTPDPNAPQSKWGDLWKEFKECNEASFEHKDIRTVTWDPGNEVWEMQRMAEFGKLSQVRENRYEAVNAQMRWMIRLAYNSGKNFIIQHKVAKEYVMSGKKDSQGNALSEWNGKYTRGGFKDTGYLIQANIRHFRNDELDFPDNFGLRIVDCRQNMSIAGLELNGADCNFATLAQMVFPDTDEDDWK